MLLFNLIVRSILIIYVVLLDNFIFIFIHKTKLVIALLITFGWVALLNSNPLILNVLLLQGLLIILLACFTPLVITQIQGLHVIIIAGSCTPFPYLSINKIFASIMILNLNWLGIFVRYNKLCSKYRLCKKLSRLFVHLWLILKALFLSNF